MLRKILETSNGDELFFGGGKFDDWCIYVARKDSKDFMFPLDSWYFTELKRINDEQPEVYEDFVRIYEVTTKETNQDVIDLIRELASKYDEKHLVELIYSILYAGMIAEENKENTMLGKRIKRLGMYQTLVDNMEPATAANFSRGMRWQEIDEQCKKRGF
jgi:hypothetical protein